MKLYVKYLAGIVGLLYIVYGVLGFYNWLSTTFPLKISPVENFLAINIPSDVGASIALLTIGSTLMLSVLPSKNPVQNLSALTVGTILALALFALQILVITANLLDTIILSSVGEKTEYNILADVQRIEFYGGLLSLILMYFVIQELSERNLVKIRIFRRK